MQINLLSPVILLVDTVHLRTDDFQWSGDESGWDFVNVQRSIVPSNTYSPTIQNSFVSCRSFDSTTGWDIRMSGALKISGSIPRLIHGNNFMPIYNNDMKSVREYIHKRAEVLGLKFDVNSLKVSRADFACNRQFACSPNIVIAELSKLTKCGNLQRVISPQLYEGTSCMWGNTERQLLIYDKTQEMKKRKEIIPSSDKNYIRSEIRLISNRSCKQANITCFGDLNERDAQIEIWRKMNLLLLDSAERIGICEDTNMNPDIISRIEDTLLTPKVSTRQLINIIAGMGLDAFYDLYGGQLMFEKYLYGLHFHRIRRDRFQKHIKEVHKESNRFKKFSVTHNVWKEYKEWIHSL